MKNLKMVIPILIHFLTFIRQRHTFCTKLKLRQQRKTTNIMSTNHKRRHRIYWRKFLTLSKQTFASALECFYRPNEHFVDKSYMDLLILFRVISWTASYCSVHGVQHMFCVCVGGGGGGGGGGNVSPGNCCCKWNCATIHQKPFFLTENIPHEVKNHVPLPFYWFLISRWGFYNVKVACVAALLNDIDLMMGTRSQNGAIKCM